MSIVGVGGGTALSGQSDACVGDEDGARHGDAVLAAVADPPRKIGDPERLRGDIRHATGGGKKVGGAKDSDNEEVRKCE